MMKGTGSLALAGPALVKAVTGQDIAEQELGGSKVHSEVSGVGDGEFATDADTIDACKKYLSYFPSNCDELPPDLPVTDPVDRREESLLDLLPESTRKPYDMYKLIRAIVDHGDIFDIKPKFARSIITCLARIGGKSVGIVANQPNWLGGILENDSADKAARFMQICDAFNVPLVFLQDVPGFMVGSKVEHAGIIRHGAKMMHVMSAATVPKITVVVRKAYGAGYYVMCGRAYEPDLIVSWPTGEISVMGAEGMVGIAAPGVNHCWRTNSRLGGGLRAARAIQARFQPPAARLSSPCPCARARPPAPAPDTPTAARPDIPPRADSAGAWGRDR